MDHIFFIDSSADELLDYFQFLAAVIGASTSKQVNRKDQNKHTVIFF